MSYIGASPRGVGLYTPVSTSYSGNGSTTLFTLPSSISNTTQLDVFVDSVYQNPFTSSYSVSGTSLTFSEAPASGSNNIVVTYRTVVA